MRFGTSDRFGLTPWWAHVHVVRIVVAWLFVWIAGFLLGWFAIKGTVKAPSQVLGTFADDRWPARFADRTTTEPGTCVVIGCLRFVFSFWQHFKLVQIDRFTQFYWWRLVALNEQNNVTVSWVLEKVNTVSLLQLTPRKLDKMSSWLE